MASRDSRSASPNKGDNINRKDYTPANPSHLRQFEYPPDTPKPITISPGRSQEPSDYFSGYLDNTASGTITTSLQGAPAFSPDGRLNHAAIRRVTGGNSLEGSRETSPSPEGPATPLGYHTYLPGYGGYYGNSAPKTPDAVDGIPPAVLGSSKKTVTGWMAQKHGIRHRRLM